MGKGTRRGPTSACISGGWQLASPEHLPEVQGAAVAVPPLLRSVTTHVCPTKGINAAGPSLQLLGCSRPSRPHCLLPGTLPRAPQGRADLLGCAGTRAPELP